MANVYDVGQYITELVPTVNTMKLYKLCYFSQGWKLAWTGCLLFQEPLQAWANGPIPIALRDRSKPGGRHHKLDDSRATYHRKCGRFLQG